VPTWGAVLKVSDQGKLLQVRCWLCQALTTNDAGDGITNCPGGPLKWCALHRHPGVHVQTADSLHLVDVKEFSADCGRCAIKVCAALVQGFGSIRVAANAQ
jgi:hypothetical protein